ncbi:MAG: hypothetical protein JNK11_12320 [Alphaproteobacteria bacterium]|nr:hypothetical protein [Alphaproteobacteria bacterium]
MMQSGEETRAGHATERDRAVFVAQIAALYDNSLSAFIGIIGSAALAVGALWHAVEPVTLVAWLAVLLLVHLVRLAVAARFGRSARTFEESRRWALLHALLLSVSGAVYGSLGWLIFDPSNPLVLALVLLFIGGTAVAGVPFHALYLPSYLSFAFINVAPLGFLLLLSPETGLLAMGLSLVLLLAVLAMVARKTNSVIRTSLALRFENESLIHELQAARENAEQASSAKSRFLAHVTHELRTPLNAVIGFSEIIAKALFGAHSEPRYQQYARDIHASGVHLLGIIDNILDLSKIESGTMALSDEIVDLGAVVQQAIRLVSEQASRGRVAVTFESAGQSLWRIRGDGRAILQVALNILANAVKFTLPDGRVTARIAGGPAGETVLTVQDTGIGIAADEIVRIFEPFKQGNAGIRPRFGGTGLGLAISKRLVELHGGQIAITSRQGEGTTVSVTIPPERCVHALSL